MNQDKKGRLVLLGGFALIVSLGLTSELVKVPLKSKTIEIKKVPVRISTMQKNRELTDYKLSMPNGYKLSIDEKGNFYGYKEIEKEKTEDVKLGDYLAYLINEKTR